LPSPTPWNCVPIRGQLDIGFVITRGIDEYLDQPMRWRRLIADPRSAIGCVLLAVVALAAAWGPALWHFAAEQTDFAAVLDGPA
jgi:hypothetical protein